MVDRIPFQRPQLPSLADIAPYFSLSERARFYSNGGPCSLLLEQRLAERIGARRVCVGANATLSLMVASRAVFGSGGGIVIVPSFTFAATATAVEWAGFRPHFVDTDPDTMQMCPISLKQALAHASEPIAGVMACGSFGIPSSHDQVWLETAAAHGVPVVFDAAAAFGSVGEGRAPIGRRGRCEVFSMHATKPFAVGEGSFLATDDDALADEVRRLQNFGFSAHRTVDRASGINAKLPELTAAVGLAVLDSFDDVLRRRADALALVRDAFEDAAGVPFPIVPGADRSALQFIPIRIRDGRDRVAEELLRHGIETRLYYHPLHTMAAFAGYSREAQHGTDQVWSEVLALPMANDLSHDECRRIGAGLAASLGRP